MYEQEKQQIREIAACIAEKQANDEMLARLAALIESNEELQEYYSTTLFQQMLLQNELDLGRMEFCSVVATKPDQAASKQSVEFSCQDLATLASLDLETTPSKNALPTTSGSSRRSLYWGVYSAIAATLFVALYYAFRSAPDQVATVSLPPTVAAIPLSNPTEGEVVVRDDRALSILGQLTRTGSLDSIRLSSCLSTLNPTEGLCPCTGTAWLEQGQDNDQPGYLVALEPGQQMDILVDASAWSQNSLSMVELDSEGRLSGGWTSFNNLYENNIEAPVRRHGLVGQRTEYNASNRTRYFLFAGSHILPSTSSESTWHLSDCRVRFENDFLLAIGWDDRVYVPSDESESETLTSDKDFNDMVATIHFTTPEVAKVDMELPHPAVEYMPAPIVERMIVDDIDYGQHLEVKPGERLILSCCSSAELQNRIRLIELDTNRVVWVNEGTPYVEGQKQPGDRGIYVISNRSDQPQRFLLQVHHHSYEDDPTDPWRTTFGRQLCGNEKHAYFGFEDSLAIWNRSDWQDICVSAHWVGM